MEGSGRARRGRSIPRRFRLTPYPTRSYRWQVSEGSPIPKTASLALERRDWEDATCSVCMEFPHNAVLLLCSSHDKGCRPYMCGTSYRYSNCLDQFKKAYTKVHETLPMIRENPSSIDLFAGESGSRDLPLSSGENQEVTELAACPLCRGQVKGWTVVEPARRYLNNKKRDCMQDDCSFMGTYRELKKHVRSEHPCAKPRQVDPTLQQKWRRLEHEREHQDVISTIRSSMPRSVVFGDYVIEMTNSDLDDTEEDEVMGGDGGHGEFEGGSPGISRSILYFFLREGARFMRLQREPNGTTTIMNGTGDETSNGYDLPSMATADGTDVGAAAFSSGGDDDYIEDPVLSGEGGVGMLRAERRRRRRRRSRGSPLFGVS